MVKKLPRNRTRNTEPQPRIFARGTLHAGGVYPFTKTEFRRLRLFHGHDGIIGGETIRIPASYRATLKAEGLAHVR